MKNVLKFSGLISLILAVIAFILMMATNSIEYVNGSTTLSFGGSLAIFGGALDTAQKLFLGTTDPAKLSALALLAWIFMLLGMLIILCGIVLPLLKINALEKFAGLLNLVAVILFVVAGIFMFCVVPNFFSANGFNSVPEHTGIGAGWVIGGILAIIAGGFAILPAVMDFLGKRK